LYRRDLFVKITIGCPPENVDRVNYVRDDKGVWSHRLIVALSD
jgi:hypothetical protein